ncbi:MAG TPA: RnfABCDGE type electron transport complex subunit D [Phycisphaerae bacterium]|nr:RnfABCDGE type electron transport complex subunit D [Phycisphaerae bacterium]HOI55840.1 RnfABCDGE type electron transport complex subunit D [Phycisphaerae bacterium]
MTRLTVSSSPHIRQTDSTAKIMWSVVAALTPALVLSGYLFGWRALWVTGLSVLTAVVCEALAQRLRKTPVTIGDGSAVITGILVAFCMPATVHWYVPVFGSAAAILIAKQCFGGLGCNIWNPALVGRAIVHVSFAKDMNPSSYPVVHVEPSSSWLSDVLRHFTIDVTAAGDAAATAVDAITGPSPMAILKKGLASPDALVGSPAEQFTHVLRGQAPHLWDAFWGNIGGNIGEVSALLLLAGVVYLVVKGYVRWYSPALYLGTVAVLAAVLPLPLGPEGARWVWAAALRSGPDGMLYPLYHLVCGGLMLGALYMATDMVTSPLSPRGQMVFAVGCGVLTVLIRLYGGYPEGVCYSILLMNTAVPLIDRWTRPRVFGTGHKKPAPGASS